MPVDPVALLRRYHAALNCYHADEIAAMFAANASYHSPGVGALQGRDDIISAFTIYFTEHPDQRAEDDEIVALNQHTARARWRLAATSRSTAEPYQRCGIETVTFNEAGLIASVVVEDQ